MVDARNDLSWRAPAWEIVTGWNGADLTMETEIRRVVQKQAMVDTIERIISLVDHCKAHDLKLCVWGD
jgi:hypothetical protein